MERRPLRMLVLEPDARLAALLRSTLEPEGFDVTVAASLAQMRSLPAARASDVVLVDEVLAASDGAAGLRSLLPVAATLLLTGASGGQGPDALRLMHDLGAAAFLRKPYSLLDLPTVVRRYAPLPADASASPPPANGLGALAGGLAGANNPADDSSPAARNALLLGRLWSRRSSGRLSLSRAGRAGDATSLSVGGVDGAEAWELVRAALAGEGSLVFESGGSGPSGDWVGLGAALLAGMTPDRRRLSSHQLDALHRRCDPSALVVLPLPLALRRLVEAADPYTPLGVLERQLGLGPDEVSDGLARLLGLGLIAFQQPIPRPKLQSALPAPAPVAAPRAPERLDSDAPTLTGASPRSGAGLPSASGGGGPVARSRSPHSTDSDISRASTSLRRGSNAVRAETLRRLQVEKSRLVGVSGWVVLGIPEHSPPDLIAQASSRMRRRYRHLAARTDLDAECRRLARDIEAMVDRAEEQLSRGSSDSLQGAGENLLEIGKRLIQARDWVRADRVLARAAEQSLSNPEVLANHGWARLNNPERPEAERRGEGRDLLLLAEQLDPRCLDGQLYLARYYVMSGDVRRAGMRADRALRIAPEDPEAQLLVQECRTLGG